MKRVSIFTGKVYPDDYRVTDILECCICVDPAYKIQEGIERAKQDALLRKVCVCSGCLNCEESKKVVSQS